MLEFLFELIAEFVLQLFGELLAELGLRSLAEPFRKEPSPWFAAVGYTVFGAVAGGLSLLVFRTHFIAPGPLRFVNLMVTPIAVGLCMSALGTWRERRGQRRLRIDRFLYGYVFALALGAVRYHYAH